MSESGQKQKKTPTLKKISYAPESSRLLCFGSQHFYLGFLRSRHVWTALT